MTLKLKPVAQQVIVITGASSGIGLATAQAAAARGASVVLSARSAAVLEHAAAQIKASGGNAVHVVADVSRREDVERIAAAAIKEFGRIDTWVNNAGVGIWGRIEETPEADMRALFDTNFWGEVYGSLVALPYLKATGGALINVGSVAADRAIPLQGIYSASKHAVKGFTEALRAELIEEGAPVSVTLIKPSSIGTPISAHVRNYTGREAKLPPPIYAPEDVADTILHAAAHPTRDAFVGGAARVIAVSGQTAPRLADWLSGRFGMPMEIGRKPATPDDNLYSAFAQGNVRGDQQGSIIRRSLYTRAAVNPNVTKLAAGGAVVALAAWLLRPRAKPGSDQSSE